MHSILSSLDWTILGDTSAAAAAEEIVKSEKRKQRRFGERKREELILDLVQLWWKGHNHWTPENILAAQATRKKNDEF